MHCAAVALLRRCAAWLRCWHAVFDTAEAYAVDGYPNQAEVIVGKALQHGRRSEAIIAGKFGCATMATEERSAHAYRTQERSPASRALTTVI
jgi:aryl-alcohol dehydrogenase-like predicted oxidoreductase